MNYDLLLNDAKSFINELYVAHDDKRLPFHNFSRTTDIIKGFKQLSAYYKLDDKSSVTAEIALLFSQAGFVEDPAGNPAAKSVELASAFLDKHETEVEDKAAIINAINAGLGLAKPNGILEAIVADTLCLYYGMKGFKEYNKLRRKEYESLHPIDDVKKDWTSKTIEILAAHEYYTDLCKLQYTAAKLENLEKLKSKQEKASAMPLVKTNENPEGEVEIKDLLSKPQKAPKTKNPVRGIEMMFRLSSSNNVRISVMADNKSHIMITVNSIIISVVLGLIVKNIDTHRELVIPSLILLIVNVVTIIYSVLATRPGFSSGVFTPEQVEKKSVNMLFFGSFHRMGFDDYNFAMRQVMKDSDFLYSCLIKDLYWQGKVLGRKYNLLRKAYTFFLYGIIISVVAFAIGGFMNY